MIQSILSNKIKRDNYDNFLEDKKFKMQDFMQDLLKKFFKFSNEKIKTEPIIYNYDTTLEELCENKNIKFKFDCKILCDCLKNYENKNYCGKDNCQYGNKIIEKTFDIILNCDIENNHELLQRVAKFINFLNKTKCKKIIVVSHSGILDILLKIIFKINVLPKGDMKNGKNCSICHCTLKNNLFSMVSPQNTEHLGLI